MRDVGFHSFRNHSPGSGVCVLRPPCHKEQRNEQSCPRQLIRDFEKWAPHSWIWFEVMSLCWPYLIIYREVCIFWGRESRSGDRQRNEEFRNPHCRGAVYSSRDALPACVHVPSSYKNSWSLGPFVAYGSLCIDFKGNGFSVRTRELFSHVHLLDWNIVSHRKCQRQ